MGSRRHHPRATAGAVPGHNSSCLAIDPDGHVIQFFYYSMQQAFPTGRDRELVAAENIKKWPETVDGPAETFLGEPYLGPWGS